MTFGADFFYFLCISSMKTYPILLLKWLISSERALANAAKVFYRARADVELGLFDRASRF